VIKEMKTRAVGQVLLVLYTFLQLIQENRKSKNLFSKISNLNTKYRIAKTIPAGNYELSKK
jgi:hypothetical protein